MLTPSIKKLSAFSYQLSVQFSDKMVARAHPTCHLLVLPWERGRVKEEEGEEKMENVEHSTFNAQR
jgi:hypothetical protein